MRPTSPDPAPDLIAALATPPGRGAISIVRLSGDGCAALCAALTGRLPAPRQAALCDFCAADGSVIDRGVALYFPAPRSYTGEDGLEIQCHGSPVVVNMLLRRCLELGARLARPGEFSERAFINGKLDLTQAEAVADLIAGASESAARSAMQSLQGEFSARIHALTEQLTELRVLVEAELDFPEEGVDYPGAELGGEIHSRLQRLSESFAELRTTAQRGKLLRDGLKVVLTGPPNAGKSSLLNAMSMQSRAIISDIPGTTRDTLEQHIELDGLPIEIIDTAGIRDGSDPIETEGVRRALAAQAEADLILLVVDDAETDPDAVTNWLDSLSPKCAVCVVRNKTDLSGRAAGICENGVAVSALNGDGLESLRDYIKTCAGFRDSEASPFIARQRHLDALTQAAQSLDAGIACLQNAHTSEVLAEELAACQRALGEITGVVRSDDLLGRIFATFCIGK